MYTGSVLFVQALRNLCLGLDIVLAQESKKHPALNVSELLPPNQCFFNTSMSFLRIAAFYSSHIFCYSAVKQNHQQCPCFSESSQQSMSTLLIRREESQLSDNVTTV